MFSLKLQSNVSIYVSAKAIYLTQIKGTFFGPALINFGKLSMEPPATEKTSSVEDIVGGIKKIIAENRIKTKKVIAVLPGKNVLIRYFQIPRIPKSEWETAINFEAKRYVPFKLEELMWDFYVTAPNNKHEKLQVTFVAVKKQIVESYLAAFKQAGLDVLSIEPSPFSLMRLARLSKQLPQDKPAAIVDIGQSMADINIVKDKICYLTRDVSLPAEKDAMYDTLLNEIRMSGDYFEKLFPAEAISKVLLSSEIEFSDWDRRLEEELKIPVNKIDFSSVVKNKKGAIPFSLAAALGTALKGFTAPTAEINLANTRKVTAVVRTKSLKQPLVFTAAMRRAAMQGILFSCIILGAVHFWTAQQVEEKRKELNQVIALRPKEHSALGMYAYQDILQIRQSVEKSINFLNAIITERILLTEKFNALPALMPAGIWLTKITINNDLENKTSLSLLIEGIAYHEKSAEEVTIVTKLVSNFKGDKKFSRGFSEIKLDSMSSLEIQGKVVKGFRVLCAAQ